MVAFVGCPGKPSASAGALSRGFRPILRLCPLLPLLLCLQFIVFQKLIYRRLCLDMLLLNLQRLQEASASCPDGRPPIIFIGSTFGMEIYSSSISSESKGAYEVQSDSAEDGKDTRLYMVEMRQLQADSAIRWCIHKHRIRPTKFGVPPFSGGT